MLSLRYHHCYVRSYLETFYFSNPLFITICIILQTRIMMQISSPEVEPQSFHSLTSFDIFPFGRGNHIFLLLPLCLVVTASYVIKMRIIQVVSINFEFLNCSIISFSSSNTQFNGSRISISPIQVFFSFF